MIIYRIFDSGLVHSLPRGQYGIMKLVDLERMWISTEPILKSKHLLVVCNSKKRSNSAERRGIFNMDTEYFSDDEFEQIVSMFRSVNDSIDFFTYEDDFISYIINNTPPNPIVYNAAQSGIGPGRKSLVPAFCNLHGIPCAGSNAYVVSLCRHKYHVNKILSQAGIPVPKSWLYSNGWLMEESPDPEIKVLLKPIYESASIGIDNDSIQIYSADIDRKIHQRTEQHHQPIMAQEFIPGYEVETPMICVNNEVFHLPPVGISISGKHELGDEILDYELIYHDRYGFYDFATEQKKLSDELCVCAEKVSRILGMEGLCRVDFRIKSDGSYFVTDVSANPHFVLHSSVDYSFKKLGLTPSHIARTILSVAVGKG